MGTAALLDVLTIDRPEQLKALGHPLRLRVLEMLGGQHGEQLTNRELAQRLGVDPGHLHFHVRMLLRAGLVELAERGRGREKPYRAVARTIRVAPELLSSGLTNDVQAAMLDEVQRGFSTFAPEGSFRAAQITVRLDPETARTLIQEFLEQLGDVEDAEAEPLVITTLAHPPTRRPSA